MLRLCFLHDTLCLVLFYLAAAPGVNMNNKNAVYSAAAGVLMTSYEEPANRRLKDFFKVLSLSLARDGLPYISTMEARKVRVVETLSS